MFCSHTGLDPAAGDAPDWTDVFSGGIHEQPGAWPQQQIFVDFVLTVPYSSSKLVFLQGGDIVSHGPSNGVGKGT